MYKVEIPFYKSQNQQCGQTCCMMIMKCLQPDSEPDLQEVNKIINYKPGKNTFPLQLAIILNNYGIQGKCYSNKGYFTFGEKDDLFSNFYGIGKEFENQKELLDLDEWNSMVEEGRSRNLFQEQSTTFDDIIDQFVLGDLAIFPIDWNTVSGESDEYDGHFVVLSGVSPDRSKVLIHDPDVGPFVEYERELIEKAYSHPAIDQDCVIVSS